MVEIKKKTIKKIKELYMRVKESKFINELICLVSFMIIKLHINIKQRV